MMYGILNGQESLVGRMTISGRGEPGVGIETIVQTETSTASGGRNTWTVTLTDGRTSSFYVRNGAKGDTGVSITNVAFKSSSGLVDTYEITFSDGNTTTFNVTNGNGISSIAKTGTSGNVDTYTINYTNGTTSTFTVTNSNVSSVNGQTGDVVLTANEITYDETAAQTSGSIGKEITDLKTAIETKANIDGNYKDLTAGSADQLVSTQYHEDQEPYLYRTSGGSTDIGDLENDAVVGGSVVWNQIINPIQSESEASGITRTIVSNGFRISGTATADYGVNLDRSAVAFTANHVYLLKCVKDGSSQTYYARLSGSSPYGFVFTNPKLFKPTRASSEHVRLAVVNGATVDFVASPQVYDLTTMFGSTIADYVYSLEQTTEGSGIAWLKKYGFFAKDYYEYCEPTMRSVEGLVSHDMVGFNQWDGEIEAGQYNRDTGAKESYSGRWRSKNKIPCFPHTAYYNNKGMYVCFYDANENYISSTAGGFTANRVFTTPNDCRYMTFSCTDVVKNAGNICINLSWSGTRNGEYEAYEKASYPLDSSLTLRGIPKLDSQNQLYYDGDTYEPDGTVTRRYGVVDLGTLDWSKQSGSIADYFRAPKTDVKGNTINMICSPYSVVIGSQVSSASGQIGANLTGTFLYVRNDSYTDAATFKAAMSGVYLVYELATPTTETATPFVDPQRINDWGTEEYVCESESDFMVPVGHDTKYRVNLRDKLQHLPDMADNDGYYLIQQIGSKMSLVNFRIPQAPTADGYYILKATVSGGVPTYTWEAVVESTATEVTG